MTPKPQHCWLPPFIGNTVVLAFIACFCLTACSTQEAGLAPKEYLASLNAEAGAAIVATWTSLEPASARKDILTTVGFTPRIDKVIFGPLKAGATVQCQATTERGYPFPAKSQKLLFLKQGKASSWTVIEGALFDPANVKLIPPRNNP